MNEVRALIVDDNAKYRLQLRQLLMLERIQVVGEAANGWEAIELADELEPDVVLMDQNMPALGGIDATIRIKQARPKMRVIFVAAEHVWEHAALQAGAEGYFVKGDGLSELMRAIREPGFTEARKWQREEHGERKAIIRKVVISITALASIVLISTFAGLPANWFPAVALLIAIIALALFLRAED